MQSIWPQLSKTLPVLMQVLGLGASIVTFSTIHLYGRKTLIQRSILTMVPFHLIVFACFLWQGSGPSQSTTLNLMIVCSLVILPCIFSLASRSQHADGGSSLRGRTTAV